MKSGNIKSTHIKLSDIRTKRSSSKWTSENSAVNLEPGDKFYGDKEGRDAFLQKEFEASQKLKELHKKAGLDEGIKPLIFNEEGKAVPRGEGTNYTGESVSVMKAAGSSNKNLMNLLDQIGQELEEKEGKESLKSSMNVNQENVNFKGMGAKIGTFNIEWLGTKKRSSEDYEEIAEVIRDTGAQVLGIQEVSDEEGLKEVMGHLPEYGYILGKSGEQRVGVIFDRKRVQYDMNSIDQIDSVVVAEGLRAPLMVDMKIDGGFDFTFVVAHLKAMMDKKSRRKRTRQANELNRWIDGHLKRKRDKDLIIVGDFNDLVASKTLKVLNDSNMVHFATEEVADDKHFYSNIPFRSLIDQTLISTVPGGASEEFIPGSFETVNQDDYNRFVENVSDHKPVWFEVRSDIDND